MKRKYLALSFLGAVLILGTIVFILQRPGPNTIRNGKFEQGLKHWQPYADKKNGSQASFGTESIPSINSAATKISVKKASYYDSVSFGQTGIKITSGQSYILTFRARSTIKQLLRAKITQSEPPWTFYGFRVVTEITPQWQTYRLTGRTMLSDDDAKLTFQCGGHVGDVWIADIQFQEAGLLH